MGTFREFELAAWEDPATCGAYQDRLGAVVAQAIEPLLPLLEDENTMVQETVEGVLASLGWKQATSS